VLQQGMKALPASFETERLLADGTGRFSDAGPAQRMQETPAARARPVVVRPVSGDDAEMAMAQFQQVLGGQAAYAFVVKTYVRQAIVGRPGDQQRDAALPDELPG